MRDFLASEKAHRERVLATIVDTYRRHGFTQIETPVMENIERLTAGMGGDNEKLAFRVMRRGLGADDLAQAAADGDASELADLGLRYDLTVPLARFYGTHRAELPRVFKSIQIAPVWRAERPQKGRYRQFHQAGAEALGFHGPDVDAELILMCRALWRELGLIEGRDLWLEINSLGQPEERRAHRAALIAHLEAHADLLDDDAKRRLHSNPLRILDTKTPAMQAVVDAAPRLIDFLGEASLAHFDAVRAVLDAAGLPYRINPRLVRGMDYYNLTVFEWVTDRMGAPLTVGGGGRYDSLIEQLGGKPAPGVGWGLGIERLLLLLDAVGVVTPPRLPDAYAVLPAAAALPTAMVLIEALRAHGASVVLHPAGKDGPASMKSQFKKADASGARHALVFGADELAQGMVALKPLRAGEGAATQVLRPLADPAAWAGELLRS